MWIILGYNSNINIMGAFCISQKSEIKNIKPIQKTSPEQPIKQALPQNPLT